jgi:hypothetical protein
LHGGGFFKVFLIIAALSLFLDWYVFNGLRTLTSDWHSERLRQLVKWGYLVISVGVTVLFIGGFGSFSTAKGMTPFHEWMLSLFLTFFVTKIFFVLVLFLGDTGRFF